MQMQSMTGSCRCETCALATSELVPSEKPWKANMGRAKPRVPGHRCHASRPATSGFAIVRGGDFCTYWTDPRTGDQPLRRLISEAAKAKEANA